ncbi:MAG: EAL domain-containing protein [Actinobacteria bacterium]|nr:EAL domain-containing protein [Actinomycetota bacterium]
MSGGTPPSGAPGRGAAPVARLDAVGAFRWDRAARVTRWDEAASEMFGLEPGTEPSGRLWYSLVHPEDRDRVMADSDALPLDARTYQHRYRVVRPDGRVIQVLQVGVAVDRTSPGPHQYVGSIVDWTTAHDAIVELEDAHAKADAVVTNLLDPLLELEPVLDDSGALVDLIIRGANPAAQALVVDGTPLLGTSLVDVVGAPMDSDLLRAYRGVHLSGEPLVVDGVEWKEAASGEIRAFDVRASWAGERMLLTYRDVTDRQRQLDAVAESERLFRTVMHGAAIGMAVLDMQGGFRVVNQALCDLLGRDPGWLAEHRIDDVILPDDLRTAHAQRQGLLDGSEDAIVGEMRLMRADGAVVWVRRAGAVVRDTAGRPELVVVQIEDITAQKVAMQTLEYQAFHDSLTGLPNRVYAAQSLEHGLETGRHDGSRVAVLTIDVDRFALVNDSLGHAAGDTLLTVMAARISSRARPSDTVARIGGDEFVVVMSDVDGPRMAEHVAREISRAASQPLSLEGHRISPTLSIGIAMSDELSTPDSLFRDSDAALVLAKQRGRNRVELAEERIHERSVDVLVLEDALQTAVARREFVVHYQPIVDMKTGDVVAHEALVRWMHPERGVVGPPVFMEVAESSGLVADIDRLVLEDVCRTMGAGRLPGRVSVNVSAVDLRRSTWLDDTLSVIGAYRVDPARLVLEVTETTALAIPEAMRWALDRLRDVGVGLHVDDFGTGFSTISLLQDLPVTGLKLDARFVRTLTGHSESRFDALAAGLSGLAHGLGLIGVAEGVETAEQWEILRRQGWDEGQGWLFGYPAAVL